MSENYSELALALSRKIEAEEKEFFIIPITEIEKEIESLKNASYKELSNNKKEENGLFLKNTYSSYIKEGKAPAEAKEASQKALIAKLEKDREAELNGLEKSKQLFTNEYTLKLEKRIKEMSSLLFKWPIKKEIKSSINEFEARNLAEIYATAYNSMGYQIISPEDIMMYYPSVEEKEDKTLDVSVQENTHTRYYDTEVFGNVKISPTGFILTSTEYTITQNINKELQPDEYDKDEQNELNYLKKLSPRKFQENMFTSDIAEQEIIDRCLITHCNYTKDGESVAGVQVKYEGTDALNKFYEVCNSLLTSDAFHKILGKTSPFLVSDFVNYNDVLIKRIKEVIIP